MWLACMDAQNKQGNDLKAPPSKSSYIWLTYSHLNSGDSRTYLTKKSHTSALNYKWLTYSLASYSFKAVSTTQHTASKNTSVFISLTKRETPLNLMCGLRCLLSLAVYSEACCRLTAAVSELVLLLGGGGVGLAVGNISKASLPNAVTRGNYYWPTHQTACTNAGPLPLWGGAEEPII